MFPEFCDGFAFHTCHRSEEWQAVPDDEKETLGLTFDHYGEFWYVVKLIKCIKVKNIKYSHITYYVSQSALICAVFHESRQHNTEITANLY